MSETVDVYWSFRSPYSYLVTPDLMKLQQDYDVEVCMRIVYPVAIRNPSLVFDPANRNKSGYIVRDSRRRAEFLNMPFRIPARPDPVVQDPATYSVPEDQPYIYRLSALGVEAQRRGKGVEFVFEVSALIFGGTDGWDQGELLSDAVARSGLDLQALEAAIEDGEQLEEVDAAGHWGVPTMVVQNEPFFGQDRIETLRWRLDQMGLARSA